VRRFCLIFVIFFLLCGCQKGGNKASTSNVKFSTAPVTNNNLKASIVSMPVTAKDAAVVTYGVNVQVTNVGSAAATVNAITIAAQDATGVVPPPPAPPNNFGYSQTFTPDNISVAPGATQTVTIPAKAMVADEPKLSWKVYSIQ
jgi:hypothetical protein